MSHLAEALFELLRPGEGLMFWLKMEECELAVDSCSLTPLYTNRLAGTPIEGGLFDNWGVVLQSDESFVLPIPL